MPVPPETPRPPEQEPQPYYLASRFPSKQAAEQPYVSAEATIHEMDCDLSAYRFMRQWHEPNTNPWYVLVIGVKPEPSVEERIKAVLSQGEMASVPQEAVAHLYARRLEEIKKGPWVEHHYTVIIQKRNPKKDKLKRKQQKDSRRRNRGNLQMLE